MIQSKDAYYIDIPKTASTFLESCLHLVCKENTLMYHTNVEHKNNNLVFNLTTKKYVMDTYADEDSNFIQSAKHGCLDYNVETHKNKLIFATIKNPWEYYVSKFVFRNIINPRNATNPWIESAKNSYSNFENTFEWVIKNVFVNTTQHTLTNQIMHKTKKNYLPTDDIEIET